jgi:formylglycine-generating enzyme required for sulfatase activity
MGRQKSRRLRSSWRWWPLSIAIVVVGAAAMAGLLVFSRQGPMRVDQSALRAEVERSIEFIREVASTGDPSRLAEALDGQMVAVPAGEFLMGSDQERPDERPRRRVTVDGFAIDRYEVTNAQYRRFLEASAQEPPPYWQDGQYPQGQDAYPVVGVSWFDADAYCRWAGKRLPTEAEWEKACRGTEGRIYPWGNRWDPGLLNTDLTRHVARDSGDEVFPWQDVWSLLQGDPESIVQPGLQPVGSYAGGASPYGMLDASGNASEWVADWYNWTGYQNLPDRNPLVEGPPWNHCVRGSAWYDLAGAQGWAQTMSRCSARNSSHEMRDPRVGFRCARSPGK